MAIRKILANPEHEVVFEELAALVNRHGAKMTGLEILAVAANMVGKIIALQDQRTVSVKFAMDLVLANIEAGNQEIFNQVGTPEGNA